MIRDIAREANMSVGHGNSTSRSRTVRSPQGSTNLSIEEVLEAQAATRDLEELVEGGCDRAVILSHLAVIRHSDPRLDDIGYWTGQTRREVEATEEYFQKCASKLESLLERPLKAVLAGPSGRSPLTRAFELPQDLRRFSGVLRQLLTEVSGRKRLSLDMARASLVRYIKEHTGTWHDREVASLVSAVLDGTHLTEAHQRWRRTKYHRLAEILAQVSEEKPTGYVASPPPVPTCASAVSVQQLMALP